VSSPTLDRAAPRTRPLIPSVPVTATSSPPSPAPVPPKHPRVGVVVLTQSDRPELHDALASVRSQRGVDAHLVLVVNGAPAPGTTTPDHLIELPENVGIPAGRNIGAAAARADVVVFLDDDAELLGQDHLASVLRRFDEDPGLGAMAIRIVDESGATQRRHVPRLGQGSADRSGPVTHFIGAACAVRASAFNEIGGFDPRFFYSMEESDLAWRLQDRGWGVWYSADLAAFHPRTPASRHARFTWFLARNRAWMAWRSLPLPLLVAHLVLWTGVCALRRHSLRDVLAGYREAWATRPARRPMRWRTIARMTRLGRPPVV